MRIPKIAAALAVAGITSASASSIMFITPDTADDQSCVELLTNNGHSVTVNTTIKKPTATDVETLNSYDLVIFSRQSPSGDYNSKAWNSLTTGMIVHNPFVLRESRWAWMNGNGLVEKEAVNNLNITEASHPLFDGITLTDGSFILYDQTAGHFNLTHPSTSNVGGTILATTPDYAFTNTSFMIAEWEAGESFYTGGSQVAGGKRLFINLDENALDVTAAGETLLLNSVDYMTTSVPEPSALLIMVTSLAMAVLRRRR